ncbi:MAG: hypothetical protein ABIJ21_05755 [Nanoarchaeota archaeon]
MPQKKTKKAVAKKTTTTHSVPEQLHAKPNLPLPVKIISVFFFLGSALFFLVGIILIFGANLLSTVIPLFATIPGAFITIVAILVGIFFVAIGVTEFFTARGLWQGKSWARILAIVLSLLGFAGALLSLANPSGWTVLELLIDGAIAGYLLFSTDAKSAFQ